MRCCNTWLPLIVYFCFFSNTLFAQIELYTDRPDILSLRARSYPEFGRPSLFKKMQKGSVELLAQLIEMYPDHHLYFLARDAEYFYDLAKVLLKGTEQTNRMHLLNVSQASIRSPYLMQYLAQEGITPELVEAGKKVLFVDTGFRGTIPRVIGSKFPPFSRTKLKTHLICSFSSSHPSSRVFLRELSPAAIRLNPRRLSRTILQFEYAPHYTHHSHDYQQINGQWVPISSPGYGDRQAYRETSVRMMRDLKHYANQANVKNHFQERRSFWRHMREISRLTNQEEVTQALRSMFEQASDVRKTFIEAAIRDYQELTTRNLDNQVSINLTQVGLPEVISLENIILDKNYLIQEFPQWAHILENPDIEIPKLRQTGDLTTLGALMDVVQDFEIYQIFARTMGAEPALSDAEQIFFSDIIKTNENQNLLRNIATHSFENPYPEIQRPLIDLLIQKGNPWVLLSLAEHVFPLPHTAHMTVLIARLIIQEDQNVLHALVQNTFSKPHTAHMTDLIARLIKRGEEDVLEALAQHTFSKPHFDLPGVLSHLDNYNRERIREFFDEDVFNTAIEAASAIQSNCVNTISKLAG